MRCALVVALSLVVLLPWIGVSSARMDARMDAHYAQTTLQYDPSGAVLQVAYAREAVRARGGPILGLCTEEGVVLAILSAQEGEEGEEREKGEKGGSLVRGKKVGSAKVCLLEDDEVALCVTGLQSDAALLVETAKSVCREYRATYDCCIPSEALASSLADILHAQTRRRGTRPLAVAAIVAGYDVSSHRPSMFAVDTEGSCTSHHACFLGSCGTALDDVADDVEALFSLETGRDMSTEAVKAFLESRLSVHFHKGRAEDQDPEAIAGTGTEVHVRTPSWLVGSMRRGDASAAASMRWCEQ